MQNRFQMTIALSLFLFSTFFASSAFAYVSLTYSSSTIPSTIEPGSRANLLLAITNAGTEIASLVQLKVGSTQSINPDQSVFNLGTLNPGSTNLVTIPMAISSNAAEGTAALPFTVSYGTSNNAGTIFSENSATISITKRKLIQIVDVLYDKDVVQRGDTIKMTVVLQNLGRGQIKDLTVSLRNFSLPIAPAGTDTEKYVGTLNAGDKTSVVFDLVINTNADTITYSVPVSLTYFDDQGVVHSDVKFAGLKIAGIPNFVVSIEKEDNVFAGSKGKLTVSVANIGTGTAKFLTAYATATDSDVAPRTSYIGNLDPDDSSTISLDVNPMTVGKHQVTLHLSYKDAYNQDFAKDYPLAFDVGQRPIEIPSSLQILLLIAIVIVAYLKRSYIFRKIRRK